MLLTALIVVATLPAKLPYRFEASFIESCSCRDICVTEITGRDAGCHGVGAIRFKNGSYGGRDLSGTAGAFAFDSGKWVSIYVDAPAAKRAGVTAFMKAALADWGKLEEVRFASVRLNGGGSVHSLLVDKGQTAAIEMRSVLGGDGKTAVAHTNLTSPLHSSLMQGATTSAHVGGAHAFKLTGSNGFFNDRCVMNGSL
jgi:hypothetical protein